MTEQLHLQMLNPTIGECKPVFNPAFKILSHFWVYPAVFCF